MPEPLTDLATGEPTELPVARVGDAVRSGQYKPAPDTQVPVLVGNGVVELVAAKDLDAAMDQGWQLASESDVQAHRDRLRYESAAAQARTAGEAAARGLTLGLSDAALVELGANPEDMLRRKELNPGIALTGELTGALVPLALSGGSSGAATAAGMAARGVRAAGVLPRAVAGAGRAVEGGLRAALGEGVLARGAAMAGAGAAEGGIYGLGQAISESALGDIPLTTERVLSKVGTSALLGGGVGGVLGTTAASLEKHALPKIRELLSTDKIERLVDRAQLKQWSQGRGKAMFTRLRRDFGDEAESVIARAVRDEGLDEVLTRGATWDEVHAITKDKLGASGRRIGETLREIDAALPGEAAPAAMRAAERVSKEVLAPLRSGAGRLGTDKGIARKLERDLEALFPKPSTAGDAAEAVTAPVSTFETLHALRARIDDVAFPKGVAAPTPHQQELQKVRAIIEDELTTAADVAAEKLAAGGMASGYSAEKLRYRAMQWLNKAAESNAASEMANRTVSLSDYVSGSAVTAGSLASLLTGDLPALGATAISMFMGAGASVVNKFLREQGQQIVANMGEKVIALQRTAIKQEREAAQAVSKFFDASTRASTVVTARAAEDKGPLATRYQHALGKLETFERAPEVALSKALGDTKLAAPQVAQAAAETAQRAAAFLRSKAPTERIPMGDAQPTLPRKGPRVSDSQMARYLRYVEAVEKPHRVFEDLARGEVKREQAEALRAVYPKLYADLVTRVEAHVMNATERLPRDKLIKLSLLLDRPLDPTMEPAFIASCQAVHAATRAAMQNPGGGGRRSGNAQMTVDQSTEGQRLSAGR